MMATLQASTTARHLQAGTVETVRTQTAVGITAHAPAIKIHVHAQVSQLVHAPADQATTVHAMENLAKMIPAQENQTTTAHALVNRISRRKVRALVSQARDNRVLVRIAQVNRITMADLIVNKSQISRRVQISRRL